MKMNFNFECASVCLDHFLLVQKIFFIIGSIIDLEPRNEKNIIFPQKNTKLFPKFRTKYNQIWNLLRVHRLMEIQIRNQSMDPEKVLEKFHILGTIPAKITKRGASAHIFQNSHFFIRNMWTRECRYITKDTSEVFICGFGDPIPFFEHFAGDKSICVYLQNALGVRSASSRLSKKCGNRQHRRNFWSKFLFRDYVF